MSAEEPLEVPTIDLVNRTIGTLGRPFQRQLHWLWSRGFRFLFVIDAMTLFGLMTVINVARFGTQWPTYPRLHYFVGFGFSTMIHLTVNYFAGLYEREPRIGSRPWLPRIATAMGIGIAINGLSAIMVGRYLMPRLNLGLILTTGILALSLTRHLSRYLADLRRGPVRLILLGRKSDRQLAREHIQQYEPMVKVVAEADDVDLLFELVQVHHATDVLLLELASFASAFPEPLTTLDALGISAHQRVSAAESLLGLSELQQIGGIPFIRVRTHGLALHQLRLKRIFDLFMIIFLIPIFVVVLLIAVLYTRVVVGRPIIYRQVRLGRNGTPYHLLKLRTMYPDAERDGAQLSSKTDERVIPGMRWIRATRLDELPQVWNVLQGNMSLVGPRPERPELVSEIAAQVDGYTRRLGVPPGITGLAQIHGRYDTAPANKLGYDLQYLVNWSIGLDVQILLRTVLVIVSGRQ